MARKEPCYQLKIQKAGKAQKAFEWKIGIYIRLSKEDLRNNDESEKCNQPEKNKSGICRGKVLQRKVYHL